MFNNDVGDACRHLANYSHAVIQCLVRIYIHAHRQDNTTLLIEKFIHAKWGAQVGPRLRPGSAC